LIEIVSEVKYVSVPDFQSLMLPFLQATQDGEEYSIASISNHLVTSLNLSKDDIEELLPSGLQTRFKNRVYWVATHFRKSKVIESTRRGSFKITERGKQLLKSNPDRIDMNTLNQYPEYLEFRGMTNADDGDDIVTDEIKKQTPDELIEELALKLKIQFAQDLLEQVKQVTPDRFESIVLDVLVAMGYGGSTANAHKIGRVGDGGIDGIIKEDKLGLDFICVQAKRWQNQVGVSTVREFAGSLLDRKARKGVLITTSNFSSEARDYATRAGNIVILDGQQFAELMITYGVGVTVSNTYKLYKIDTDYFEE
jgi:restriction system protein